MIYLDTHVLVALYAGESKRLSSVARKAIDSQDLYASPAAVLELHLLHEIGRLRPTARRLCSALADAVGLRICPLRFDAVVERALDETWVRDPFDRLIVAHAKASGAALLTRDERILEHYPKALW